MAALGMREVRTGLATREGRIDLDIRSAGAILRVGLCENR
jgi:hypothetical protein